MCGRLTLTTPDYEALAAALGAIFSAEDAADYLPRFNIAPTQWHPVLHTSPMGKRLDRARWGLVNTWARDRSRAAQQINARSEKVDQTRAYKDAFQSRRCVVPATGFFEWAKYDKQRIPHYFYPGDDALLLMAGLYELWSPEPGHQEATFTILTTSANPSIADIHHRMPVLLDNQGVETWLDDAATKEAVSGLLVPAAIEIKHHEVSSEVNKAGPDHAGLIVPGKNTKQGSLF